MHIPHVLDTCVVLGTTIAAAAGSAVLSSEPVQSTQHAAELQLFLLPFIGSIFVSGMCIMFRPAPEERRIVIGRAMAGVFVGVLGPQIIGAVHPALEVVGVKPVFLMAFGGVLSWLGFALSKPFTRELYARSEAIAKREADRLESKYSPEPKPREPDGN